MESIDESLLSSDKMNIWALPKAPELRLVLLKLDQAVDISRLNLGCDNYGNHQAIHLCDVRIEHLCAYLYSYGQTQARYGLQLHYPALPVGSVPVYDPLEELTLKQVIELLCMHFGLV